MNHFKLNTSVAFNTFTVLCTSSIYFQNLFTPTEAQIARQLLSFLPPPLPGNHQHAFCPYEFTILAVSHKKESYNMWPFVSGFFHLALCPWGSCSIVFDGRVMFCCMSTHTLCIHPATDHACICGRACQMAQLLWKTAGLLKKLIVQLPPHLGVALLGISPREMKTCVHM